MLTKKQIELVKATVPVLREHGVALTSHFYKRMLSHNPELRQVFNMGPSLCRKHWKPSAAFRCRRTYRQQARFRRHPRRTLPYRRQAPHCFYQGSTGGGSYGRIIRCLGCRLLSTRRHPYRNREKHLRQKRSCRGRLDRLAVFQSFREVQADGWRHFFQTSPDWPR